MRRGAPRPPPQSRGCWLTVNYVAMALSSHEIVFRRNFPNRDKARAPESSCIDEHTEQCIAFSTYNILLWKRDSYNNAFQESRLTMLEAIMKEALISIIRQEHMALEARIAEEMQRQDPDGMRLEAMQEEATELQRQLERYEELIPNLAWTCILIKPVRPLPQSAVRVLRSVDRTNGPKSRGNHAEIRRQSVDDVPGTRLPGPLRRRRRVRLPRGRVPVPL